jgi:hypothetical protein
MLLLTLAQKYNEAKKLKKRRKGREMKEGKEEFRKLNLHRLLLTKEAFLLTYLSLHLIL